MSGVEGIKDLNTQAGAKENKFAGRFKGTLDEVTKLLAHIDNVTEIKDEFLSEKLTGIFNTRYLDKLFKKLVEFHSGVMENAMSMGISILSEDDIVRKLQIRQIVDSHRFIVYSDTQNSISNLNIGIKDLSLDPDSELANLAEESTKYIGKDAFYLDDFMTKEEWKALVIEIFEEDGILIIDKDEFWRK